VTVDTAEVWLIRAAVPGSIVGVLNSLLDERERHRAGGWRWTERRRYIVAHGVTRLVLGDRLGTLPTEIHFTYGENGKPELPGLHLSLSHSGEFCMLALSPHRPVGVDIQQLASGVEPVSMALRYFSPEEARFVAAASPVERARRFARLWTRKEALTKAFGGRLVRELCVPVGVTRRSVIISSPIPHRLADIRAPQGFRAAIALAGRASFRVTLRRWRWEDQVKRIAAAER
jgi:4'-phosphopantetheinyl transferase